MSNDERRAREALYGFTSWAAHSRDPGKPGPEQPSAAQAGFRSAAERHLKSALNGPLTIEEARRALESLIQEHLA